MLETNKSCFVSMSSLGNEPSPSCLLAAQLSVELASGSEMSNKTSRAFVFAWLRSYIYFWILNTICLCIHYYRDSVPIFVQFARYILPKETSFLKSFQLFIGRDISNFICSYR